MLTASVSELAGTNIQDNSLVHVAKSNLSGKVLPTVIVLFYMAALSKTRSRSILVPSSTFLDGAHVEKQSMLLLGRTLEFPPLRLL